VELKFLMLPTCLLPKKVESLGADALIAVNNLAGGHRGNLAPEALIKDKFEYNITCYLCRGVSTKSDLDKMVSYGAVGVSVGSPL
jgi:nitronate monooxygenase